MRSLVLLTCLCLAALVGIALIGPDATATEVAGCSAPALGQPNCYAAVGDCATYSYGCDTPAAAAPVVYAARPRLFGRWHARKAARHASYASGSAGSTATFGYAPVSYATSYGSGNCAGGVCY